jgi:hypothetical protein
MTKVWRAALVVAVVAVGGGVGVKVLQSDSGDKLKVEVAQGRIADEASDAQADGTDAAVPGRADITAVSADYRPDGIMFSVMVREPVDPLADPNWTAADTFLSWDVDTTGDGVEDWDMSYSVRNGKIVGEAEKIAKAGEETRQCYVPDVGYSAEAGYTMLIKSQCLGEVKTANYRVGFSYNTNVNDEVAPTFMDNAPEQGMAAPLGEPISK